jgi:hypothetical protein
LIIHEQQKWVLHGQGGMQKEKNKTKIVDREDEENEEVRYE